MRWPSRWPCCCADPGCPSEGLSRGQTMGGGGEALQVFGPKIQIHALRGMARLVRCRPTKWNVASSTPSPDTCLRCRFTPCWGPYKRHLRFLSHLHASLTPFLPPFPIPKSKVLKQNPNSCSPISFISSKADKGGKISTEAEARGGSPEPPVVGTGPRRSVLTGRGGRQAPVAFKGMHSSGHRQVSTATHGNRGLISSLCKELEVRKRQIIQLKKNGQRLEEMLHGYANGQ